MKYKTLAQIEKDAILKAVKDAQGNKLLAAKRLGIGKTTLYRKLNLYAQKTQKKRRRRRAPR